MMAAHIRQGIPVIARPILLTMEEEKGGMIHALTSISYPKHVILKNFIHALQS